MGLKATTSRARRIISVIDALVRRSVKDPALLANWASVKHAPAAAGTAVAIAAAPTVPSNTLAVAELTAA